MKGLAAVLTFWVLAITVSGCATPSGSPTAVVSPGRAQAVSVDRATRGAIVGRSTRADVTAALGETLTIVFDSGYEVWVYTLGEPPWARGFFGFAGSGSSADRAEFVVLFAPTGVVAKTRVRPLPQ